jgi:hypothetical protein
MESLAAILLIFNAIQDTTGQDKTRQNKTRQDKTIK